MIDRTISKARIETGKIAKYPERRSRLNFQNANHSNAVITGHAMKEGHKGWLISPMRTEYNVPKRKETRNVTSHFDFQPILVSLPSFMPCNLATCNSVLAKLAIYLFIRGGWRKQK